MIIMTNLRMNTHKIKMQLCGVAKRLLHKHLILKIRHNFVHKQEKYHQFLLAMSNERNYAEGTTKTNEELPSADSLLYHLKKFRPSEIMSLFDRMQNEILKISRRNGKLANEMMFALDITEYPYYGRFDGKTVNKISKEGRGTLYAYKYISVSIVDDGVKFIVKTLPLYYEEDRNNVLEKILDYLKRKFKIKIILFDRGFYSSKLMEMMDKKQMKYCIFVPKNKKIQRGIEAVESFEIELPHVYEYKMNNGYSHKMHLIKSKKEILCIATNSEYNSKELLQMYSKRWNIETGFRLLNSFKPMTTSQNFVIRLFYQLFAQTMHNLWILVKLLGNIVFSFFGFSSREFKQTLLFDDKNMTILYF